MMPPSCSLVFRAGFPFLTALLMTASLQAQKHSPAIFLNQAGFYPLAPKTAMVAEQVKDLRFFITSTNTRDTFFTGTLSAPVASAWSPTVTRMADFTRFTTPGTYFLLVPNLGHSHIFTIGNQVHRQAAAAVLKGFYFQRSSQALPASFAGIWQRGAGHPDTAVRIHPTAAGPGRPAGMVISSPGGWYDAGDYNKYIVNSGITMGTLLSAWEDFPEYFSRTTTQIPESANQLPDLLDEIIYNLRWMLTMQDPHDGGVYHKCTNAAFDDMVMPGVTRAPRYVVQKSTPAALDFAAVTAQAGRVLKPFAKWLPGLADSCLKAASAAWAWAEKNPDIVYDQQAMNERYQPAVSTGAYGDGRFSDEKFWAAAELFISTRQEGYLTAVLQHAGDAMVLPSWNQVAMLGGYSLLRHRNTLGSKIQSALEDWKARLLSLANGYFSYQQRSAFRTVMGQSAGDFEWGSNSNAANQGILLIQAWRLTQQNKYLDAALSNLDYIMGRNATGYCFITGVGSKSPLRPHHRQSVADGVEAPVPGLLVGGPNPGRQDSCTYAFTDPETAFTDTDCSYASNEIAINWNAPAVYLLHALEAMQTKAGYAMKDK